MELSQQFFESLHEFVRIGPDTKAVFSLPHVNCAIGTTRGLVREENQDRSLILRSSFSTNPTSNFLMFAISDGIGGMAAGAACATQTVSAFAHQLVFSMASTPEARLLEAFQKTNSDVFRKFNGKSGATLSALLISKHEQSVVIGNIGDSRVYGFQKGEENLFEQITVDDTIEAHVAQIISKKISNVEPELKGRLAQYMGMSEGLLPTIVTRKLKLEQMEGYALTTDGIHDISRKVIGSILLNGNTSEVTTSRLLDLAVWCGGNDNATAIVVSPDTVDRFMNTTKHQERFATAWSPYRQLDFGILESTQSVPSEEKEVQPQKRKKPRTIRKGNKRIAKVKRLLTKNLKEKAANKDSGSGDADEEIQISIEFIGKTEK